MRNIVFQALLWFACGGFTFGLEVVFLGKPTPIAERLIVLTPFFVTLAVIDILELRK